MQTTKVKWLMDGKRQIERFGSWVWVNEGEVSDHPTDQLGILKEGIHFERVVEEAAPEPDASVDPTEVTEAVAEAPDDDGTSESGPESVEVPIEEASKPKAPKKSGRRKIGKGKG